MKWIDKISKINLNAVLVTVLIHLVLFFGFLLTRLQAPEQQNEAVVLVDPEKLEEMEKYFEAQEKVEDKMQEMAEKNDMSLSEIKNLARSGESESKKTNNSKESTAKDLQKQYEEEIRKEMYGEKYNEIKKELEKQNTRDNITGYTGEKEKTQKGDADYYSGPSLVKVKIKNKNLEHYYIDIPVFTCKGSGKVVVSINIDQHGNVVKTEIKKTSINSDRECLMKASRNAALNSRFESSKKGTSGTISYQFIPQN